MEYEYLDVLYDELKSGHNNSLTEMHIAYSKLCHHAKTDISKTSNKGIIGGDIVISTNGKNNFQFLHQVFYG